jgi:uncharacterized delta-60 repeat protein
MIVFAWFGNATAAPGDLDTTFSGDGKVISAISTSGDDVAKGVAIQRDGKIVVAGYCTGASSRDFCVARYNSNGTLDDTFSSDGKVIASITSSNDDGRAVAIQADGKIVVAGTCGVFPNRDFCLARFTDVGILDDTFSSDGRVVTPIGLGDADASSIAIAADGKIIVAGSCVANSKSNFCVARYLADGELDPSWFSDGTAVIGLTIDDDFANSVAIQPDGKIVIGGYCGPSTNVDFCLVRFLATTGLDTMFGSAGRVFTEIGTFIEVISSLALQADGKIVAGGTYTLSGDPSFAITRYNVNGSLDVSFSNDGIRAFSLGSGSDAARATAIQVDGKIVLAGRCDNAGRDAFCVARLNGDGTNDQTFSTNGTTITPIGLAGDDIAEAMAIDANGNIVLAGTCGTAPNRNFCVARFEGGPFGAKNCSPDIDGDGKMTATVDALINTRVMLGLTGSAVTGGITFPANATRNSWSEIRTYLVTQCGMAIAP